MCIIVVCLFVAGDILQAIYRDGFKVTQIQMCHLTKEQASAFYAEHNGKPFFKLVTHSTTLESSLTMWKEKKYY